MSQRRTLILQNFNPVARLIDETNITVSSVAVTSYLATRLHRGPDIVFVLTRNAPQWLWIFNRMGLG